MCGSRFILVMTFFFAIDATFDLFCISDSLTSCGPLEQAETVSRTKSPPRILVTLETLTLITENPHVRFCKCLPTRSSKFSYVRIHTHSDRSLTDTKKHALR